jgi:putative modified peptide
VNFQLSDEIAERLLGRLSNDDEFRALFEADPRQALCEVGFAPAADRTVVEGLWICLAVKKLASKETLRKSHEQIKRHLLDKEGPYNPIGLGCAAAREVDEDVPQPMAVR